MANYIELHFSYHVVKKIQASNHTLKTTVNIPLEIAAKITSLNRPLYKNEVYVWRHLLIL